MENQKNRLKYLLGKYAAKHITGEELEELRTIVDFSDNEELDVSLREMWMNKEYPPFMPTEKQMANMIFNIEKATQNDHETVVIPLHRRFVRSFSRIAAVFVLALLSGICVYLYQSNQNLGVYRNSEITLNVSNGQEAEFTLPDGTSVRLNLGSTLNYANNFGENKRLVDFSGEAFFDVKKDAKRPFIVSTKYMDVEVVGTSFNVYAFDNGDLIEVTLVTGSIKASSKKNPERQVFVKPGEKVVCDISTGELAVQEANMQYETAWLNGETVFKSETLRNALAKLERKYGIRIRYEGNNALLDDRFSGRIGKDNHVGDVMKILTNHYPLKYEQKGETFVLFDR